MFGTQEMAMIVRRQIVSFVANNWNEYSHVSQDSGGDNYNTPNENYIDMIQHSTYGGLCELVVAGNI